MLLRLPAVVIWLWAFLGMSTAAAAGVELGTSRLEVGGTPAPYLFGAELQYFRARGGSGRNVPRADVEQLWDKLLDRFQEAHMNMASLYVPWDFHEPEEGVFDFDGRLDRDGDGRPDYPSRDLRGFLRRLVDRGVRYVILRPGPYINAEWGPEGFGAIPGWFLDRYPEALAGTRTPGKPRVATYAHPVFRTHVEAWFTALYDQVLREFVERGDLGVLVQLDNETNYFWDSVYERDLSPVAQERYHAFLGRAYGGDITRLNHAYQSSFPSFAAVTPPTSPADRQFGGFGWHYDWYQWHDDEIRDYFRFLRSTWEKLGLREPNVLFTRCDSFNNLNHGLLPRLDYAQDSGLALSTLNIYPKTYGTQAESTMNTPMKAAHDAALLAASHQQIYGKGAHWVMATETVGGWFPPTEVSLATRQHTYASLLGSGVKAMIIYYFHEGWNWDGREQNDSELAFDAPLDRAMQPRSAFALLKNLGAELQAGLGDTLVDAAPLRAPVLIAHDNDAQYPVPAEADAAAAASTDSAALFGLFRAAGSLPALGFVDRMSDGDLAAYKLVVWRHPGYIGQATLAKLQRYVAAGGTLLVVGDGGGQVVIPTGGKGRVVRQLENPAAGWDGDEFPRLPGAGESLSFAKHLLADAGVAPIVDIVQAEGQEAFVHGWLVAGRGKTLLFVENFTRSSHPLKVRIAEGSVPSAERLTLSLKVSAESGAELPARQELTVGRDVLTGSGVTLNSSADGVDIWEISPAGDH